MKLKTVEMIDKMSEYSEENDKVLVSRRKIGRGWSNAKSFLLPKEIELNENNVEAVALYLGDGKTTKKDMTHADFTSKDFDLSRKMFLFFKELGVKVSDMTFTISYSNGNVSKIINEVSLYIGKQKFRINKTKRNRHPAVHIQVNGVVFRKFFQNMLMGSLQKIKEHSHLRRAFLRGYFAAEGWIGHHKKENYLASVGFSYNPRKEEWLRDFCIRCLKLEGIDSKIRVRHEKHNGQIIITNWKNYYNLWKLGVFDGCFRKKKKFLKLFLETKICCDIKRKMREKLFSEKQEYLAGELETYQSTISHMKTGSERNMWPTVEQVEKLCSIQGISLQKVKNSMRKIRFGNLTILESDESLLDDIFNRENLYSSVCQEDTLVT